MQNEAFIYLLATFIVTVFTLVYWSVNRFLEKRRLQQWMRDQSSRVDAEMIAARADLDSAALITFQKRQLDAQRAYDDQLRNLYQDEDERS